MVLGTVRKGLLPIAVAALRISTGYIMAVHGWQKLNSIPQMTEALRFGLKQ